MTKVELDPPGTPLPLAQRLVLRYFVGPYVSNKTSWEENLQVFETEGRRILSLVETKAADSLSRIVLVPSQRGLEDSSRNWSAAMTLDHLMIVGRSIERVVLALSEGKIPPGKASTAAVKPKSGGDAEAIRASFGTFVSSHAASLLARVENRHSSATFAHPWFGPMKASQWFWLLGTHQAIHRQQIEEIVKVLP